MFSPCRAPVALFAPISPAILPLFLRMLRAMRDDLARVQAEVTIQGPIYRAIFAISNKIDDLAGWLTGNREYFWAGSSQDGPGQIEYRRRWSAIERGDEPWPEDGVAPKASPRA